MAGLVPLVTTTAGTTLSGAGLALALQQTILEVVEGADTVDVFRVETTDQGIEGIVAHHGDPSIEVGDVTCAGRRSGKLCCARSEHTVCAKRTVVS